MMTAPLVRALASVDVRVMAEPENADLFGAGSLLDGQYPNVVPPGSTAFVWGTGMLTEWSRFRGQARVLALRGPLSWARCGRPSGAVLGDPGLLVGRVWPAARAKRYRLGIVPHYVDAQHEGIANLARRHPEDVTVIDICAPVPDVLRAITECEAVLSSSLHGLVFADAYGVPCGWLKLGDRLAGTPGFKVRDHYAALGRSDVLAVEFTGGETIAELQAQCEAADERAVAMLGDGLVAALLRGVDQWRDECEAQATAGEAGTSATLDDPFAEPLAEPLQ